MQDKDLLERAKHHRKNLGPFEARLWARLSRSQLGGYKFRRQYVVDHCIVDFFCPEKGLIVEVDGDTHDQQRDFRRDYRHEQLGFATLRFSNADLRANLGGVLETLLMTLETLPDRWLGDPLPHPNSSPEGEGK